MTRLALAEVLGAAVLVGDIRVGKVVGLYLDAGSERVIGVDVACADGPRRLLPWAVASVENGSVRASSALHFLDDAEGYERLGAVAVHAASAIGELSMETDGRVRPESELVSAELALGTSSA